MSTNLPKVRYGSNETAVFEKAWAMLRRGRTPEYVSDYLGMDIAQVRSLHVPKARGRPKSLAPAQEESSGACQYLDYRLDAINGSQRLGEAIDRLLGRVQ